MELLFLNVYLLLPIPIVLLLIVLLVKLKRWSLAKSVHVMLPAYLLLLGAILVLWSDYFLIESSSLKVHIGLIHVIHTLPVLLIAVCASAAALFNQRIAGISSFIAAAGLAAYTYVYAFQAYGLVPTSILVFIHLLFLLFLCGLIMFTGKISDVAPASANPTDKKNHVAQTSIKALPKQKAGSALKRGIIGSATGFIVMLIISIALMAHAGFSPIVAGIYSLAGLFYGFGFTFANWKYVLAQTKTSAIEGASGLAIGFILAHMFKEKKSGLYGWLYFLFRVSWHLGLCWIPGIGYGVSAICKELRGEALEPLLLHQTSDVLEQVKAPSLLCTSGTFEGAEFRLNENEIITIGSNPSSSQIILSGQSIQDAHCKIWFDQESNSWCVVNISGGKTYRDEMVQLKQDILYQLSKGSILSIGSIEDIHQFRLL